MARTAIASSDGAGDPQRGANRARDDARTTADRPPRHGPVPTVIASDVRLLCDSLAMALAADPEIEVIGTAGDLETLLTCARRHPHCVVVLDVTMPGALGVARDVMQEVPSAATVAVAVEDSVNSVVTCAEAGISGYVPYDASLEDLRHTVLSVSEGETPCPPRVVAGLVRRLATLSAERDRRPAAPPRLTPREYEVLRLIRRGLSNKEIASSLHIALPTVKNHVHRILGKLEVDRRGAAADWLRD